MPMSHPSSLIRVLEDLERGFMHANCSRMTCRMWSRMPVVLHHRFEHRLDQSLEPVVVRELEHELAGEIGEIMMALSTPGLN